MCAILNKDLKHLIKEEQLLYQNFTDFCATTHGQKGVYGPKQQGAHCSCPQSTAGLGEGVEQSQRLRATAGNHQGSHWDTAPAPGARPAGAFVCQCPHLHLEGKHPHQTN